MSPAQKAVPLFMFAMVVAASLGGALALVTNTHATATHLDCEQSYSETALQHLPWGIGRPKNRKEIADLRVWARTQKDPCVRDAYLGWADYAAGSATQDEIDARNYSFPVPPGASREQD